MKYAALLLLLLWGVGGLAESRTVFELDTGSARLLDGGTLSLDGGLYLPPDSELSLAKELTGLKAENAQLKASLDAGPPTPTGLIIVAAVAAFLLGAGVTFAVTR